MCNETLKKILLPIQIKMMLPTFTKGLLVSNLVFTNKTVGSYSKSYINAISSVALRVSSYANHNLHMLGSLSRNETF